MADKVNKVQCIQSISDDPQDQHNLRSAGWDGPGWYFWDAAELHGPFSTDTEAMQNLHNYVQI